MAEDQDQDLGQDLDSGDAQTGVEEQEPQRLDLEVDVIRDRGTFVVMEAKAFVDGALAVSATISSAVAK